MEQYKRILRIITITLVLSLETVMFHIIWMNYYSKKIYVVPFFRKGDFYVSGLYLIFMLLFLYIYGGLKMGYMKKGNTIYSQALSGICANVLIENDVIIGNNVTVKSGVQIWDGVEIEDNVFIGPNVTFTNDLVPRSKVYPQSFARTIIKKGASIGANSTIIAGHSIGEYAFIGAGSVITKDIPPYTVWFGNPAKHQGYVTKEGVLLDINYKDKEGNTHILDLL